MDQYFAEQFPLSEMDDYFIHQTPDPIRVAYTTDPRFFERHWNVFHDQSGDLLIATGGSIYPNLDAAEAYAIVTYQGIQRSVRSFRRLGAHRHNLHVGPIQPEIVAGMREWRHVLQDSDAGISFDLHWFDTHRQMYRAAYSSIVNGLPPGGQRHVTAGFEGFGEVSGVVTVAGKTLQLERASARGTRDRHWGIGRGVGGPRYQLDGEEPKAGWIGGNWFQLDSFAVWGPVVLYRFGDNRAGYGKVIDVKRKVRFEADTHIFTEAIVHYTFATGEVKEVYFERLGQQTIYMKCGMYGGTADKRIYQGQRFVQDFTETDCYDLHDAAVRAQLSGLNEHHCRITCDGEVTTGILQPLEPDAYQACLKGARGWTLWD